MNVEIARDSNGGSLFSCENVLHHFVLFPFTLTSDIADLSHVICILNQKEAFLSVLLRSLP